MASHRSRDFSSLSTSTPAASLSRRRERSCSPSSRHGACSSPTGCLSGRHSFSTSSLTRYGSSSYPKVSYNKRLLAPLNLDFDPSIQAIRTKEKDEIKTLNNQFAALIGKVQSLEQHNQVLLTRWNFLREQDNSLSDLDIKLLYDQYMNKLRQQIRSIDTEKEQLDLELDEVLEAMDSFRGKYEDEINKRSAMEFTFMTLKKDLDNGFLHKTELEAKLSGLHAMAELMTTIHDQELEEAMSQIKDISIVLGIDNNRTNIDPHRIVEDVRAQYEALAIRSWEELEALTRSKLHEGELQSANYGDHLLNDRRIIAELNIQIQKMRSCILSLKSQCLRLEGTIKEVGAQGEAALNDAKAKLANLEEALQNLRQDLAHLVKEYQELMNIKLALDIEILTYRELMEGEEISMESPAFAFISRIHSGPKFPSSNSSITASSHLAYQGREDSTDRMSHSRGSLESGLARSQSGGTGGVSGGGDLSRSHSNASGGALRNHSITSRGTLDSSLSRSPSSRSGNFADVENTSESSLSRNHGSGSFSQPDTYSNRSRDNLEGGLSRITSRGTSEGSLSRSQSSRSGGLTDSVFTRTPSGASEGVSEGSLSRSYSGTSTSFVEGGLSRSQSNENEVPAGPNIMRTNSAEDGGVPVGGIPTSHSRSSTVSSESRFSRSQIDKNEGLSSHESEGYVEPTVSRTNSAEDGGVPVGGLSRSPSEVSRYRSEGSFPRSQSGGAGSQSSHRRERYVEPPVSRTNSAEDGGVPVGGISRSQSEVSRYRSEISFPRSQSDGVGSQRSHRRIRSIEPPEVPVGIIPGSQSEVSRYSPERSLPRLHSGDNVARSNHGKEAFAKPTAYRTGSASYGGTSVSGISRSHAEARRGISAGSLSSLRDSSEGSVDTVLPSAPSEDTKEGSLSGSHSDNNATAVESSDRARGISAGSSFRTPSVTSAALTDSVFIATPCTADEDIHEEIVSRVPSGATESAPEAGLSRSRSGDSEGPVETSTPICYSSQKDDVMESSLSSSHSGESGSFRTADFSRSPSEASRGVSEAGHSSKEDNPVAEGKRSRNDSYLTAVSRRDVSRTYSSEAESPSGGIEAPVDSPEEGGETIPQRGLGGSYRLEEGLSGAPSGESTNSGSTYLVEQVSSDNLHYSPVQEASYYSEFNPKY